MLRASSDPVYVEAVRLLLAIPLAARSEDFAAELRKHGLELRAAPDLFSLVNAVSQRLDSIASGASSRSDLGDLAGRAVSRALLQTIGDQLPGLFGPTPEDVRATAKRLSYSKGIAVLARSFYGVLVTDTLRYWLDRTLANQIGPGKAFGSINDRTAFDDTMSQYTSEATRIIQEFAGGWYGKQIHEKSSIDTHAATVFGAVSLKKIVSELQRKADTDA